MVRVYAVVLVAGVVGLLGWILARSLAVNLDRTSLDPEMRLGLVGRRVVAAMVGFGMAGMSAEFSPKEIRWPLGLALAMVGAAAAAWYAGWTAADEDPADERHHPEPGLGGPGA